MHPSLSLFQLVLVALILPANAIYLMYLTQFHPIPPEPELLSKITHVCLAFMHPETFSQEQIPAPDAWPLFTTVEKVRDQFPKGTMVMISIGGWGDGGFPAVAATKTDRERFARNVAKMVEDTGADGVDIDWEYPGGNGEDYKRIPNSERIWEINAYWALLWALRWEMGLYKLLSAAVPGLARDMLAFTNKTIPMMDHCLDFWNIMTYDLMNRRDNITKHHTGIQLSLDAIDAYASRGVDTTKMTLGFAFYVKWFRTAPNDSGCNVNPIGCKTALMEDPITGADLGQSGSFSHHDPVPAPLRASYARARTHGEYDSNAGGHYYWDSEENIFWTWDDTNAIIKKTSSILGTRHLAGVFAYGLGEDGGEFRHLQALTAAVDNLTYSERIFKRKALADKLSCDASDARRDEL